MSLVKRFTSVAHVDVAQLALDAKRATIYEAGLKHSF